MRRLLAAMPLILALGCRNQAPVEKHNPSNHVAETQHKKASDRMGWMLLDDVDRMDNHRVVTVSKGAEDHSAVLVIRCSEAKTEVFVRTDEVLDSETSVRIKVDGEKPERQRWGRSTTSKGLFAPNGLELARELEKHTTLLFEYTPFGESPTIAEFSLNGLEEKLPAIAEACDWDGIDRRAERTRQDIANRKAAEAALERHLREKLASFVEICREKFPLVDRKENWCWHDPNTVSYSFGSPPFGTKEAALDDAVEKAKSGRAFKLEMIAVTGQVPDEN